MRDPSSAAPALFPKPAFRRLRFRGGPFAFFVFAVMILLYPVSLAQAEWVETTAQLTNIALGGIALGTLVGNGPMRRRPATFFGAAAGAIATTVFTIAASSPVEAPLRDRAVRLALHVNDWITQVVAGEAANDPTVFILFLGATTWASAYVGAFLLARERRPHEAILFSGFCLVVNVSLALTPLTTDLVLFTLCALVLLVRLHIVNLEERWRRDNIIPNGEMALRVLGGGVTWTVVLIALALLLPRVGAAETLSNAFNTFEGPYQRVEAEWQRFFAGVTGPSRLKGVSFSDSMRLGQPPNLSQEIVMTVKTDSSHFWRAVTYDFYTGAGWRITEQDRVDKVTPPTTGRAKLDTTFDVRVGKGNLLFAASEPVKADIPYQFEGGPDRTYSTSMRAVNRFQAQGIYTVSSVVSIATKVQLRKAPQVYSDEIKLKYLQLPSNVPQRVKALAVQVAGSIPNAYDKAETIENYLRDRYRYTTNVRSAPAGRDPVDYFLFDLKEDYCESFASSMVLMLRYVGVPARLVEGFTAGTFEPDISQYIVREQNAHAWVEVYFPQYGWIEFEPTPSEQPFARNEDDLPTAPSDGSSGGDASSGSDADSERDALLDEFEGNGATGYIPDEPLDPRPPLAVLGAAVLALLGAVVRFELRFRGQSTIDAAWGKTRLLGSYVGIAADPTQTAYEYADTVGRAMPQVATQVREMAHARVLAVYAPAGAPEGSKESATRAWRDIRTALARRLPERALSGLRSFLPS